MIRYLKKILIVIIVPIACLLFMPTGTIAADIIPLVMDFGGNFEYHDGTINSGLWFDETVDDAYWLDLTLSPTTVLYMNGEEAGVGGVASDYIQDSNVKFVFSGRLYNADDPNNLIFGNTNNGGIGGGETGSGFGVFFDIRNTSTNDILLSAALNNVEMERACLAVGTPWESCTNPTWNFNFDMNTLWGLEIDPDFATNSNTTGGLTYSRYIDELLYVVNNPYPGTVTNVDISFKEFTFNSGGTTFEDDSQGTVLGNIYAIPEPVSTVLFIFGSAILSIRRYLGKKKKTSS